MKLYKDDKISFEGDCIFAQIDGYANGQMTFHKLTNKPTNEIDLKMAYGIQFFPKEIKCRACFQALDMIQINGIEKLF